MKIIYPGHHYKLNNIDNNSLDDNEQNLCFVQRHPFHVPSPGTTNQEVIRVLIDRVKYLNSEVEWEGNHQILYHLRMALVLHEARALIRDVEKGDILPEDYEVGDDGHFIYRRNK